MMSSSIYTTSFDGYEVTRDVYLNPRLWFHIAFPGSLIMNPIPFPKLISFPNKAASSRKAYQKNYGRLL